MDWANVFQRPSLTTDKIDSLTPASEIECLQDFKAAKVLVDVLDNAATPGAGEIQGATNVDFRIKGDIHGDTGLAAGASGIPQWEVDQVGDVVSQGNM